jgi:hypothetical protein
MNRRSAILLALLLAGCGGGKPTGESHLTGYTAKDKLAELSEGWHAVQLTSQRPPARVEDLNPRVCRQAIDAVKKGELVVIWRARLAPDANPAIVAYEKDAPTQGGWALLQNGSVKQFSAGDFAKAPKAAG